MATYFHIPHVDKDQAKALGARWSPEHELWYAPSDPVKQRLAERWHEALPPTPMEEFPGEDRAFGDEHARLAVDMVPSTCRGTNARSSVSAEDWKRISLGVKQRAHRHCEACRCPADPPKRVFLEVHERYDYVDGVQVLRRLVCLCSRCQLATEFGRSIVEGLELEARDHLMAINGWTPIELETHLRAAYARWSTRSRQQWALDLSILTHAGIAIHQPSQEERRRHGVDLTTLRT